MQGSEQIRAGASAPGFLVHNEGDSVGVAVQDIEPGTHKAVYMDSEREVTVEVMEAIPLGHKVALVELGKGADVIEYSTRVAITREPIAVGQHVHVHNVRSAKWQNSR